MPPAKRLGPLPSSFVVLALALAGCAGFGGKASSSSPQDSVAGPVALLALHNLGPNDANITMDVTMPNGSHVSEWFLVAAKATGEHRIATPATGTIHVRVVYAWSKDGHGASGVQDLSYVTDGCTNAYRMSMDIDTTRGNSWSNQKVECIR